MNEKQYKYRISVRCPKCGEQHAQYDIWVSEKDHMMMKEYDDRKRREGKSRIEILLGMLDKAPFAVELTFRCPACDEIFRSKTGISYIDYLDIYDLNCVPVSIYSVD